VIILGRQPGNRQATVRIVSDSSESRIDAITSCEKGRDVKLPAFDPIRERFSSKAGKIERYQKVFALSTVS
jgi:hypothetical protein